VAGVGSFVLHESLYFLFHIPYLISDFMPSHQKYKVQPHKPNDWPLYKRCLKQLFFSHIVIQLPLILVSHPIFELLGIRTEAELIPSWWTIVGSCVLFLIIEDFYFYWIHRFLHWGPIYPYIHKIHHHHAAPFGLAAEYAHPVETIFLGLGTMLGPFLCATHLFTVWAWLFLRLFQTVEAHAGYDYPWSPNRFIPFWGGAEYHDFHHMAFTGNYASTFIVWDRVFGTDVKYHEHRNKQQKAKNGVRFEETAPKKAKKRE
jgi:methylsterol monooxygenase